MRLCWCGGELGKMIGRHYRSCTECGAAVLLVSPAKEHFEVSDDEQDFYGRRYWTDYSLARGLPDIRERARGDLSERCLFWLERLLEVIRPPGRVLEIGCGHGAFVRLLQEIGFDAIGTELSGWVVEFARQEFEVTVLQGPLETLDLEPGFACIAAFDVLEHLRDPLDAVRRCGELLAPNGVLVLQTPCYRGEEEDWSMLQEDEHIHLFTEESIRLLLTRAGFKGIVTRPSLFPYDMWVVATREGLPVRTSRAVEAANDRMLPAAFRALLSLSRQLRGVGENLAIAEADRAARLAQIEDLARQLQELEATRLDDVRKLTEALRESDADRAARLGRMNELSRLLEESEADRAARLGRMNELSRLLEESEADRAARLERMNELSRLLEESEADRAARLEQMNELSRLLAESEADRVALLERVQELSYRLGESEADRAARLEQIHDLSRLLEEARSGETARLHEISGLTSRLEEVDAHLASRLAQIDELSHLLGETESDRVARLEQIHELSRMLRELDADREARMDVIHRLEARIAAIERTWIWRIRRALPSVLMGRKSEE